MGDIRARRRVRACAHTCVCAATPEASGVAVGCGAGGFLNAATLYAKEATGVEPESRRPLPAFSGSAPGPDSGSRPTCALAPAAALPHRAP